MAPESGSVACQRHTCQENGVFLLVHTTTFGRRCCVAAGKTALDDEGMAILRAIIAASRFVAGGELGSSGRSPDRKACSLTSAINQGMSGNLRCVRAIALRVTIVAGRRGGQREQDG